MSELKTFTTSYVGVAAIKNPNRKWWQLWKKKYIFPDPKPTEGMYKVEKDKVTMYFDIDPQQGEEKS